MASWRWQRGENKIGCVLGLLILVAAVIVAIKTIPVVANVSEFQDKMVNVAEKGSLPQFRKDKDVRDTLMREANRLGLPIEPENIKIERSSNRMVIKADYTVTIDYPFYTYVWEKHHEVDRPLF